MKLNIIILSFVFVSTMSFSSDMRLDFASSTVSTYNSKDFYEVRNKDRETANQGANIRAQAKAKLEEDASAKELKHKAFQLKLEKAQAKGLLEDAQINQSMFGDIPTVNYCAQLSDKKISWNSMNHFIYFHEKSAPRNISLRIAQCNSPTSVAGICMPQISEIKSFPIKNLKIGSAPLFFGFALHANADQYKINSAPKVKSCLKKMQELD